MKTQASLIQFELGGSAPAPQHCRHTSDESVKKWEKAGEVEPFYYLRQAIVKTLLFVGDVVRPLWLIDDSCFMTVLAIYEEEKNGWNQIAPTLSRLLRIWLHD